MTKKTRFSLLACAGFFGAIVIFTSAFLFYFQGQITNSSDAAIDAASTSSAYGILDFGDIYSLGIVFVLLAILIFVIAKS